ncbi:MAG: SDR family NAD(P)-dependent oxidoreductase, partial [Crocinitomicaceae bacterium]|nr:SDR family NAD(P)-dependent oxidoreductase [Crocinitomicaceae bacterium]
MVGKQSGGILTKELNNLFSLEGKVIVITGAAGLLGQKHAKAIAAYGGNPILLDLSKDAVEVLAEKLNKQYGVKSAGFVVDITDELQVEKNAAYLIDQYGKIDGLVNNAAHNPKVETGEDKNFSRLENFSLNIWNQDIAVGLTGTF